MAKSTVWQLESADAIERLGYIPQIIMASETPVVEQVNERYAHGGGWHKFDGFTYNREAKTLQYPGDPVYRAFAKAVINDKETVLVFDHAWVLIDRGGDDWEVARMD